MGADEFEPTGPDDPSTYHDGDPPVFDAPWQARAFAVAVAMSEEGAYPWSAFQGRLAGEIERAAEPTAGDPEVDSETLYYEQWLAALERLLIEDGVLEAEELASRTQEFADGERTAEEWVAGERDHDHGEDESEHRHEHEHRHHHEHDHSHGHDHDRDDRERGSDRDR